MGRVGEAGKSRPAAQQQRHKARLYNLIEKVEVRRLRGEAGRKEEPKEGKPRRWERSEVREVGRPAPCQMRRGLLS